MLTHAALGSIFVISLVSGVAQIGKCNNRNVVRDTTSKFTEFVSENHGIWSVVKVIKTPFSVTLKRFSYNITSTSNDKEYFVSMPYETTSGATGFLSNNIITDQGNGLFTAKGKSNGAEFTVNIYLLNFVPRRMAYFFLCSDSGEDLSNDYRYVLGHEALIKEEEETIKQIDQTNYFKGEMINI